MRGKYQTRFSSAIRKYHNVKNFSYMTRLVCRKRNGRRNGRAAPHGLMQVPDDLMKIQVPYFRLPDANFRDAKRKND